MCFFFRIKAPFADGFFFFFLGGGAIPAFHASPFFGYFLLFFCKEKCQRKDDILLTMASLVALVQRLFLEKVTILTHLALLSYK